MYKVVFEGFDTKQQALAFAEWYHGGGEQNSDVWLEEHTDLSFAGVKEVVVPLGKEVTVKLDLTYKNE